MSKYGTPLQYNKNFKGPVKNRSCTDVICCFLFLDFLAVLISVAIFAFKSGDPGLLIYPVNSNNEKCGYDNQLGKPYLLFFDIVECGRMGLGVFVTGCPSPQICVSSCPSENFVFDARSTTKSKLKYCRDGVNATTSPKTANDLVLREDCASYWFISQPINNRCIPTFMADFLNDAPGNLVNSISNANATAINKDGTTYDSSTLNDGLRVYATFLKAKEYGRKIVMDVVTSWWMILVCLFMSMIFSFLLILIMRWIAGFMVWFTILAFVGLFGYSIAYCVMEYLRKQDTVQSFYIKFIVLQLNFSQAKFFLAFGIISAVILVISLLLLLVLHRRIRIAISLIKEASKAVGTMKLTLIWPIIPFFFQLAVIGFWITIAVFLASTDSAEKSFAFNNSSDYQYPNGTYKYNEIKTATESYFGVACDATLTDNQTSTDFCFFLKTSQHLLALPFQIFNLLMMFWMVNFVAAFGHITLAGAFASYYWAFKKPKDIPAFPILSSIGRCVRYHLGSLAFGSLLIAIVKIFRVLLEYLDTKLKGAQNPVAKFIFKCLKCCFWCLENSLAFLNKNALILIAAHGKSFCDSGRNAFRLIMRNIARVVVIDKITDFLLFISKLVVVAFAAVTAYFFFDGRIDFLSSYTPSVNFYVVPMVLVTLGSYVIASCFFNVYEMAIDTLFLCFLEDLERNDGSPDKPYYMSKELYKILYKKKVKANKRKKDSKV